KLASAAAGRANTLLASPITAAMAVCLLHVNIGNLPAFSDLPRLNCIVVIDRARATDFTELSITWLYEARAVNSAALQNGGRAVPDPIDVKAGKTFVEHRPFQACRAPVFAAIKGDIDLFDFAAPRPCQARNVIKPLGQHSLPTSGFSN